MANADVIRGGGRSMLTVADRGEGGIKFAKILLTSYVNAPLLLGINMNRKNEQHISAIFSQLKICELLPFSKERQYGEEPPPDSAQN